MYLALKNIGKIKSASIEIDGITIIAGENDTGKSTVGKALFSVFNGLHNVDALVEEERREYICRAFKYVLFNPRSERLGLHEPFDEMLEEILGKASVFADDKRLLDNFIQESIEDYLEMPMGVIVDDDDYQEALSNTIASLKISDKEVLHASLSNKLNTEFNNQVNCLLSKEDGEITLAIKDSVARICIRDNYVKEVSGELSLRTEAVYIDDPYVLDDWTFGSRRIFHHANHRMQLLKKLSQSKLEPNVVDELVTNGKLEEIYNKLDGVCNGEIVRGKRGRPCYRKRGYKEDLDIRNISAGLKTFVIVRDLLKNGNLEKRGTIILDEPEIHLHPDWQLIFAELIVLIQKEYDMHILLTTHSPYFLEAIEVYSEKHGISNRCRYYLAENANGGSEITNVTDATEKIYKQLAAPLMTLESEMYNND